MEKEIKYTLDEDIALAIKKVTGKISDTLFKETYGLNDKEIELIHEFFYLIQDKDEEE